MKPTGQRWHVRNEHELNALNEWIRMQWENKVYPTMQMMKQDSTGAQNTMIFALYGDQARQLEDKSVLDVRRECKLHYGVPILSAADPTFCEWYDHSIKGLSYEDKLILMTYMDITSLFTKEQASEYIDTIIAEYSRQGFALADPRR